MLNLLFDNRDGVSLEIVFPVKNEIRRIESLIDYYKHFGNLVFLDGGSIDGTIEVICRLGQTLFVRQTEAIGENHFVYYVNHLSRSGKCLYLFADEYVKEDELHRAIFRQKTEGVLIQGRRLDWVYGELLSITFFPLSRGFLSGTAKYDENNLHNSLLVKEGAYDAIEIINIHHYHNWSIQEYFGTAGRYSVIEIQQPH